MPRPRPEISSSVFSKSPAKFPLKFPDDARLAQTARNYLEKISEKYRTKKILHPNLASPKITAEDVSKIIGNWKTEEENIKEVSFPDALEWLANHFIGSLSLTKRVPTKRQLDRFLSVLRGTATRLLATEETSPKVKALEKRLAGLLVEGQDLKNGVVWTLAQSWLGPPGDNLTVLWNLRECLYRYYTDEELRGCGMEITETDPAKLKKRLRANLEKLLPEIDQAEKRVKSHPYYRNARRPNWSPCFCLFEVKKLFKRYGLPVEYIEYDINSKPIREQKSFLDYELEAEKRERATRYHKSEYYRCVQIVLQHGGYNVESIHHLRERCDKSSTEEA